MRQNPFRSVYLTAICLVILLSLQPIPDAYAATILVTNTNDSGDGSLRAAITPANANVDTDIIEFRIPGTGTHTITPLSPLPIINFRLTITGETEEGWAAATATTAAVLRIELDGSTAGGTGLRINSTDVTIRGLAINRFATAISSDENFTTIVGNHIGTSLDGLTDLGQTGDGISISNATQGIIIGGTTPALRNVISGNGDDGIVLSGVNSALIYGNYIGTDATGLAPLQNDGDGIAITGSLNSIGDDIAGARNVIGGNFGNGINIVGDSADNAIQGNYIGVKRDGSGAIPPGVGGQNNLAGITVNSISSINTPIGGTTALARNIISGNGDGINNPNGPIYVRGNYIGLDPTGTFAIPNTDDGIVGMDADSRVGSAESGGGNIISGNGGDGLQLANRLYEIRGNRIGTNAAGTAVIANGGWGINGVGGIIGGTEAGESNVITGNTLGGIFVSAATLSATITRNTITNNGGLGIDISPVGVRANSNQSASNYPIITTAVIVGPNLSVTGTLNSRVSINGITIDFYANTACDVSGNGEGEVYLGSTSVNTDGSGNTSFTSVLVDSPGARRFITALAIQPFQDRVTSEFSACYEIPSITPTAAINGTVTLQGRGTPPNALYAVPLRVTVTATSGGAPVYDQSVTTTTSGGFTVSNLTPGSYTVYVKTPQALSCQKTNVIVIAGANPLAMGTLRAGDANNDNVVNISDFSLLAASFGLAQGAGAYDARADFNGDNVVNISDFSLLAANFGQAGGAC